MKRQITYRFDESEIDATTALIILDKALDFDKGQGWVYFGGVWYAVNKDNAYEDGKEGYDIYIPGFAPTRIEPHERVEIECDCSAVNNYGYWVNYNGNKTLICSSCKMIVPENMIISET